MYYQTIIISLLNTILYVSCNSITWNYNGKINSTELNLNKGLQWSAGFGSFNVYHYNITNLPDIKNHYSCQLKDVEYNYWGFLNHDLWLTGPKLISNKTFTCTAKHTCSVAIYYQGSSWVGKMVEFPDNLVEEQLMSYPKKKLMLGLSIIGPGKFRYLFRDKKSLKVYFNEILWQINGSYLKHTEWSRSWVLRKVNVDEKFKITLKQGIPDGLFSFNLK